MSGVGAARGRGAAGCVRPGLVRGAPRGAVL